MLFLIYLLFYNNLFNHKFNIDELVHYDSYTVDYNFEYYDKDQYINYNYN